MSITPLKYLSRARLNQLWEDVDDNLDRYISGDFLDLSVDNGWAVESKTVKVNAELLQELDGSTKAAGDRKNSLIVYEALQGMTPALAVEEQVWVRLSHIECLEYTRNRWLSGKSDEGLTKSIKSHAFANGRTKIRDDNAISRLWWNVHIAKIADPRNYEDALRLITEKADIRQAFVERPGTATRPPLAQAIVRAMRTDKWLTSDAIHFRVFMKVLNRAGGGVLFEALPPEASDEMMTKCIQIAKANLQVRQSA